MAEVRDYRRQTSQPPSSAGDSGRGPALVADLADVLIELGVRVRWFIELSPRVIVRSVVGREVGGFTGHVIRLRAKAPIAARCGSRDSTAASRAGVR